jgi:surface protein
MLCECYNLRIVDLSEFYFENANSVQELFRNSYNIEEIIFQNNTIISSIESYYLMFSQLSKLTSIDLSHFDFSKANNLMYMFNECSSLAEIIWPKKINILSIQQLAYMFYNCNKLTSIELSGYLKCVNPSKTNTYLNTWFSNTYFSKLNFFNFSIECDSNLFINMNSLYLKDCLYYKYESDINACVRLLI